MASDRKTTNFEHLVRAWSGRVHHLAFRMLGNRAEADDATQEVFLRLLERLDAYDPERPFQPWIYAVATRSILNRIRSEKTRARKHAEARPAAPVETTEAAVERREREAVVHEGLQRIDGDARALLALHYYGGLTQDEIASVLDAPRSTVQSRLGKAVDALRESLRASGHLAALPGLEDVMRGSPPPPVGEGLVSSLLDIAVPAAGAGAATAGTWLLGGIVVTKKLLIAAAILAVLGASGGFVAGRGLRGASGSDAANGSPNEVARLVEENRRLKDDLARRAPAEPRLAAADPRAGSAADSRRGVAAESPAGAEAGAEPVQAPSALDWSRFSKLFADNAEKITALLVKNDGEEKLDAADQATVLAIFAEYMRVCVDARTLSPHPFFDERVLPDLSVALFGDSLKLTADRKKALEAATKDLLRAHKDEIDLERAGPLEAFAAREKISEELMAAAGEGLDADGKARLEGLRPLARAMLLGSLSEVRIGVRSGTATDPVPAKVLSQWKEAYGLDDRQAEAARPIAERYASDAADVLRRHGLDGEGAAGSDAEKEAARREILRLGVAAERAILGDLPPAQRAAAGKKPVTLVTIEPGAGFAKSRTNAGGL